MSPQNASAGAPALDHPRASLPDHVPGHMAVRPPASASVVLSGQWTPAENWLTEIIEKGIL